MKVVHTISALREQVTEARQARLKVGFVPTMGNLHSGHLSLVDEARAHAGFVVASIFVNPMQFGEGEDLDAYPRTLEADIQALESHACDLLFAPSASEVYPNGLEAETSIDVPSLSTYHCGASRPGHFTGVATVVSKLFNMVQPDLAVFGEKDFQQLSVIRKMTSDLCFPIEIVGVPTSREDSGLAKSSRNGYLSPEEKNRASELFKVLQACKTALLEPSSSISSVREQGISKLEGLGFRIDYLNFANPRTLEPARDGEPEIVILLAVWLGKTRLIDNIVITK